MKTALEGAGSEGQDESKPSRTLKVPEIQFHHEVTNQYLWHLF